ncbi:conserved hypothetical protein [Vibrio phage 191E37-1]|nr:conserved hypothetical protein [Vibrio phage 191E37-1]
MITCKEDLINTYIENDFGELRRAYIDKAIELGYNHQGNRERGLDWYDLPYIAINDSWDDAYVGQTADVTRWIRSSESKILTLSDLKPTPTKFVKVEESIFDLKEEFERGELHCKNLCGSDYFIKLNTEVALFGCAAADNVYRQVEIDWRDEVENHRYVLNSPYFSMRNHPDKFIAMCHAIAELTEKPEGV